MSQEPPAKQGERIPHPQLHHDLDLLRFGALRQGHFERPTFGIVPPSFLPAQISPAGVPALRSQYYQPPPKPSRYSHPGHSFLAPGPQMSLPNMPFPDVFGNIGSDGKTGRKQHTQKEFDPARQDSPQLEERPMWPNYPPGVPLPSPQMYSRLPPNGVSRKAPRKCAVSNTLTHSPQLPTRSSKPAQRRGSKQEYREKHKGQVQQDSRNDTPALDQEAPCQQRQIRHGDDQRLPRAPVRSRPLVLEDDDEVDDGDEHVPMASIEVDAVSDDELPLASSTRANLVSQRPRPRHRYQVPKGLKGVQLALGEDNWDEYVMLVEKRLLGEIAEIEFIKRSRAIFLVFNGDTRGRIEALMANKMVMPVMMEQAEARRAAET
ncbi:hypothetical protein BDU57DRAFT_234343 [Ampelomyces quisqualis]|uniref:Uncharacterized protein n=1 Tax=Ampelomyces quisqualis TaxID=50730 RepID=A0A6A5QL79_AMPQU|nr:hypothetical protein BDU57DRAFT_234343 [Ampelomyces quisqualis]